MVRPISDRVVTWRRTAAFLAAILVLGTGGLAAAREATDEAAQQTAREVLSAEEFWWKRTSQAETPSVVGRFFTALYDTVLRPILEGAWELLKSIAKAIIDWLSGGIPGVGGDWSGGIPFLRLIILVLIGIVIWRIVVSVLNRTRTAPDVPRPKADQRMATALELLADAERAHERGDQREAIRLAFLAVIAHFQDQGKLSGDRSRSNREYLRELGPWPDLSAVFRRCAEPFERCWYGGRPLDGLEVDAVIIECRRLAAAGGA